MDLGILPVATFKRYDGCSRPNGRQSILMLLYGNVIPKQRHIPEDGKEHEGLPTHSVREGESVSVFVQRVRWRKEFATRMMLSHVFEVMPQLMAIGIGAR